VVDHDARQGSVTVTVLDRGEGVAGRRSSGIFRAFARDGKKRGPEIDGMGLGLGLTRRLMAQLGGSLILSDREGGGTAATLELPAADGDDDAV
jgi:K+-sensing histidine kinase KdpD